MGYYYTNIRPQVNEYINYKSVSNKIINTMMTAKNYMMSVKDLIRLRKDLNELFGAENITITSTENPKFIIVNVNDAGQEQCEKMQIWYKERTE